MTRSLSCVRCDLSGEIIDGSEPAFFNKRVRQIISKRSFECFREFDSQNKSTTKDAPKSRKQIKASHFQKIFLS